MAKAVSKKQAGFFGRVASGKVRKKGLSKTEAKKRLRGVKMSKLPNRRTQRK